jgi:predicted transcriptional regulator
VIALNQNELEAMRVLWEQRELKPADIQKNFGWEIDNGTLRSALVSLVEKGHAARRLEGKAFYYSAAVPKLTLLQKMAGALARVFAGGSHELLVAQLVETGDIKPEDLRLIRQAAGKGVKKGRRKK